MAAWHKQKKAEKISGLVNVSLETAIFVHFLWLTAMLMIVVSYQ